jgi:hypothetical protein
MSKPVLLRDLDAQGEKSHPFGPAHAERLLAYPGTRWAKVEAADLADQPEAVPFVQRVSKTKKGAAATVPAAPSEPTDATPAT